MADHSFYATQSVYTDPGRFAQRLDRIPDDLAAVREAARQLVFHYRADGDFAEHGIGADRVDEIDTRYADRMFARIFELSDTPLTSERRSDQRLVGCCRDFTVLFLAIARHKGWPARARVGFATYFAPGWYIDHVIAEVWNRERQAWQLVEPQLADDYREPSDGTPIAPLDVPADRLLVGPRAWQSCRDQRTAASRFVVGPELDIPQTRGWPYLLHNLIHDLAALTKNEMALWDEWGMMSAPGDSLTNDQLTLLDALATVSSSDAPPDDLFAFYDRVEFQVPPVLSSRSPAHEAPQRVTLRSPS